MSQWSTTKEIPIKDKFVTIGGSIFRLSAIQAIRPLSRTAIVVLSSGERVECESVTHAEAIAILRKGYS